MKISSIRTYILQAHLGNRAFGWSQRVGDQRQTAICVVETDAGIAGGECEYTRYGFRDLIQRRAVDILQPDLCATGGFTEMRNIVALASAANLPVIPHVWGTNVGLAASLQFFAALPNFPERRFPAEPWFEYDRSSNPLRDGVTVEPFTMADGYVTIPDRPGLGITLDMAFIAQNTHKKFGGLK